MMLSYGIRRFSQPNASVILWKIERKDYKTNGTHGTVFLQFGPETLIIHGTEAESKVNDLWCSGTISYSVLFIFLTLFSGHGIVILLGLCLLFVDCLPEEKEWLSGHCRWEPEWAVLFPSVSPLSTVSKNRGLEETRNTDAAISTLSAEPGGGCP